MSLFSDDDKDRKSTPVFSMLTRYFPKSMREITRVCVANNVRYNPDRAPADINWARGKSPDQLGSAFRHMMESAVDGKVFEHVPPEVTEKTGIDKVYVLAEAAWRVCAALELAIEEQEAKKPFEPLKSYEPYQQEESGAIVKCQCADCKRRRELSQPILDAQQPGVLAYCEAQIQQLAPRIGCGCKVCARLRHLASTGV